MQLCRRAPSRHEVTGGQRGPDGTARFFKRIGKLRAPAIGGDNHKQPAVLDQRGGFPSAG